MTSSSSKCCSEVSYNDTWGLSNCADVEYNRTWNENECDYLVPLITQQPPTAFFINCGQFIGDALTAVFEDCCSEQTYQWQRNNYYPPIASIDNQFNLLINSDAENITDSYRALDGDDNTFASAVNDTNTISIDGDGIDFLPGVAVLEVKVQPNHYVLIENNSNDSVEVQADAQGIATALAVGTIGLIRVSDTSFSAPAPDGTTEIRLYYIKADQRYLVDSTVQPFTDIAGETSNTHVTEFAGNYRAIGVCGTERFISNVCNIRIAPIQGLCAEYGHPDSYSYVWNNPVDPLEPDNGTPLITNHPTEDCWESDPTCGGRSWLEYLIPNSGVDPALDQAWTLVTNNVLTYGGTRNIRKILGFCEVTDREYMNPTTRTSIGYNISVIVWENGKENQIDIYYAVNDSPADWAATPLRLRLRLSENPMVIPPAPAPINVDGDVSRTPNYPDPGKKPWVLPVLQFGSGQVPVNENANANSRQRTLELGLGNYTAIWTSGILYNRNVPACAGGRFNVGQWAQWFQLVQTYPSVWGLRVEVRNGAVKDRCQFCSGDDCPTNFTASVLVWTKPTENGVWQPRSINDGNAGISHSIQWGWNIGGIGNGQPGSLPNATNTRNSWHQQSVSALQDIYFTP